MCGSCSIHAVYCKHKQGVLEASAQSLVASASSGCDETVYQALHCGCTAGWHTHSPGVLLSQCLPMFWSTQTHSNVWILRAPSDTVGSPFKHIRHAQHFQVQNGFSPTLEVLCTTTANNNVQRPCHKYAGQHTLLKHSNACTACVQQHAQINNLDAQVNAALLGAAPIVSVLRPQQG
jgi:hypothetical protein